MNSGLRRIYWGIVFITFHIYLGTLPILPTFVGWLIILQGFNKLEIFLSKQSLGMRIIGGITVFLALIGDFSTIFQFDLYIFQNIIIILPRIFEFVFFFYLFELFFEGHKKDVVYQRIYIIASSIFIIISCVFQIIPIDPSKMILVWVGGVAIRIMLMSYISEKRKELENRVKLTFIDKKYSESP